MKSTSSAFSRPIRNCFHAGIALVALQSWAAAASYMNDFSGTGANTAFPNEVSPTGATWAVGGGTYGFDYSSSTVNPSSASFVLPGAAGTNFILQTQFTVSSAGTPNGNGITLGLGFFGATSGFGGESGSAYYLADWSVANSSSPGNLRIRALGDTTGFTYSEVTVDANPGVNNLAVVLDTTYTLRLTGTYVGTTLNMSLGVFDATGTTQIGSSATATDLTPLTGTNFGYRNRVGIAGGTFSADFDNYSFESVPEAGTLALLPLGAVLLFGTRRRTR